MPTEPFILNISTFLEETGAFREDLKLENSVTVLEAPDSDLDECQNARPTHVDNNLFHLLLSSAHALL